LSEKIITGAYRRNLANDLITSISSTTDQYYLFAARYEEYANSTIEVPVDSEDYKNETYSKMVFGKKIYGEDVNLVIPRYEWESNTVYVEYDSAEDELAEKMFYAIVNAGAQFHVYKCLYNNGNTASTVQPDFDSVSEGDRFFETSDGYIWKYIYSANAAMVDSFGTSEYFPVSSNDSIVENAVPGSIDIIKVESGGNNYGNYVAGNNYFSSQEMRIGGNGVLYNITSNTTASTSNDFYNDCLIYIRTGPANEIGQYRKIVDYVVNSTSKTIVLESAFSNAISITAGWEIYPGVSIVSDGTQTSNVVARAVVNSVANTIYKIDVLNSGAGYKTANASVLAYTGVGASNASLRVIASPKGGHGSSPNSEFGSTRMMVNIDFGGSESNTIPVSNDYRSIGILRNPTFSNVVVSTSNSHGNFLNGEMVYKVDKLYISDTGVANSSSPVFSDVNGNLLTQFDAGDYILLKSGNNSMLGVVNSVTNSTSMVLTSNALFTSNGVSYYLPRISSNGEILSSNGTSVSLTKLAGSIDTDDELVGIDSGASATANVVTIGGLVKGTETFVNTYKYFGTVVSGTFIEDETVYQGSISTSNGVLHSVEGNTIYTSGIFSTDTNIVGATSGAVAQLTERFEPELVYRSGEILYIENMEAVPRDVDQTETFKLTFEF
jgi:hypothetical protein